MTDNLTKEQRRKTMQAVKSKGSEIEVALAKALWKRGLRYYKNYPKLLGKPDIVFTRAKVAVFCDSEFWHGCDWENRKHDLKSNQEYWYRKIERTIQRDKETTQKLEVDGWTVIRFWGRQINKELDKCIETVEVAVQQGRANADKRRQKRRKCL